MGGMIPRRPSQLFRSRWSALWWALGVLVTTLMTVGFASRDGEPADGVEDNAVAGLTDVTGAPVTDQDLAVLRNLIGNGS
ncbi:hypothetical protein ACBY01_06715 [Sphingomonas sp. ac-8]|uniref:hypothetical protein n=1 Tax=Sphingomonas sp. ac-8 TaxID=3242977 RepID=UPI003A802FDD